MNSIIPIFFLLIIFSQQIVSLEQVDLVLALLVDVSSSVNEMEFHHQRTGYAESFRKPQIQTNLQSFPHGTLSTLIYWSDLQSSAVNFTKIHTLSQIEHYAIAIDNAPRPFDGFTSIGPAIYYALERIEELRSEYLFNRVIIDISGDGNSNILSTERARNETASRGYTINGLPVGGFVDPFYKNSVITPGGFMIPATNFSTFGDSIARKIALETCPIEAYNCSTLFPSTHFSSTCTANNTRELLIEPSLPSLAFSSTEYTLVGCTPTPAEATIIPGNAQSPYGTYLRVVGVTEDTTCTVQFDFEACVNDSCTFEVDVSPCMDSPCAGLVQVEGNGCSVDADQAHELAYANAKASGAFLCAKEHSLGYIGHLPAVRECECDFWAWEKCFGLVPGFDTRYEVKAHCICCCNKIECELKD